MGNRARDAAPVVLREASGSHSEGLHVLNQNGSMKSPILDRVEIFQTVKGRLSVRVTQECRLVFEVPIIPNEFTTLRCRRENQIHLYRAGGGGVVLLMRSSLAAAAAATFSAMIMAAGSAGKSGTVAVAFFLDADPDLDPPSVSMICKIVLRLFFTQDI
jgi:hypothetical protein